MNPAPKRIEIAGGGLAGLSLGLALRRAGVPVSLFEAGHYPRHRVCGEFITGLRHPTIGALGLAPILAGALCHRRVAWCREGRLICTQELPEPAWALSRYELDARLAHAFVEAGGDLRTGQRVSTRPEPGRVNATGRCRVRSRWVGLKQHVGGLQLEYGLEMHLGREAYVGLCELPGGVVNVCGLFRGPIPAGGGAALLPALRARGLEELADRVAAARPMAGSQAAVAGFGFDRPAPALEPRVGDASCMLPPFLGNGMAAAFQSAEKAWEPLAGWSRGAIGWAAACRRVESRGKRALRRRHRWGTALQGFLLERGKQRWFATLAGARCLPLNTIYRTLH